MVRIDRLLPHVDWEKTDPGVNVIAARNVIASETKQSRDNYYEPVQSLPTPKVEKQKSWSPKFLEKRRALKEAEAVIAKMARLNGAPDEAIRYFFRNDLPKMVAASQIHPKKIQERLQAALAGAENAAQAQKLAPWFALAQMACGSAEAFVQALETVPPNATYLYALECAAAYRPREAAHLLKQFFEKADLKNRMAALRTAVVSENLGDGHLIGEFFVKLMAATTKEERKEIVEPFLESLIHKSVGGNKVAWLGAYYHGWKEESSLT